MTVREIIKKDEYQSVVRDYRMQCLWPEFEAAVINSADYDLPALSRKWNEMIWKARETVIIA